MGKSADTPLMKQYAAIKARYPGALLLFRVGDFYETFGEDAIKASKILDITLTRRANGAASEVELAGFPYHALDVYLPKLVRAGQRVAICDQLEDPKTVKGIVKRGVTELVTPGVSFHDQLLETRKANYLAALYLKDDHAGVSFLDVSTGEFMTAEGSLAMVDKLLTGFGPAEVLYSKPQRAEVSTFTSLEYATFALDDWVFAEAYAYEKLITQFQTHNLKGFGIEDLPLGIAAAGAILHYLEETEHRDTRHIASITRIDQHLYVWLDRFSIRNLELVEAQHEGGVPLLAILDHTCTPMGARQLRKWIALPLKDLDAIHARQQIVEFFTLHPSSLASIDAALIPMGDMERLVSKLAVHRINPRELQQLRKALEWVGVVKQELGRSNEPQLQHLSERLDYCAQLIEQLKNGLRSDPPALLHQGGYIADGVDSELDELRIMAHSGKSYLLDIQQREVSRTGITSLKVAFNKVFGYYLEVTHAHREKVPADWIRKQTLVNAERYITEELKLYEEKILTAEDRILAIEQRLYTRLLEEAFEYLLPIQENARLVATLDVLCSFSKVATKQGYVRPILHEHGSISIKGGRHPVIECQLPPGEQYIPNDVYLDQESQQIMVITGPNMAGKSALLRQVALIVLMAQIGGYVPADAAEIGLVDKIFTRVGASDNLSKGESTFMVEMTETASILNNLSDRSLLLMDEIGRGTSTYDGISIAWAIVEYLHNHTRFRPKTLFATHYHELNALASSLDRVKNFNVAVKEVGEKVMFIRTLKPGGSAHSFGIHVAQLSGMPNAVVIRASEIMHQLEHDPARKQQRSKIKEMQKSQFQLNLFDPVHPMHAQAIKLIEQCDINTLTPVEALLKWNELKKLLDQAQEHLHSA